MIEIKSITGKTLKTISRDSLSGADLSGANLSGADLPNFSVCPEKGKFIGFKKAENLIVELKIPENAKRTSSLIGRKCRAEFARVIGIYNLDGSKSDTKAVYSDYCRTKVYYEVGLDVYPDKYDNDIRVECSHGIHFFITRKEAVEFIL